MVFETTLVTSPAPAAPSTDAPGFWQRVLESIAITYFTAVIAYFGVTFGREFVIPCTEHPGSRGAVDFLSSCSAWDGLAYCSIVEGGYYYTPGQRCNVAYFPAYPLLAAGVQRLLGCRADLALLIVSNVCMTGCVVVLREYIAHRFPTKRVSFHRLVVLVFCFFPTTFFFRMTYTEPLFLLACLATFYGIERRWKIPWIAAFAGIAAGTRSVGVVLVAPLLLHLWQQKATIPRFCRDALVAVPLALWGLLAFIVFQWVTFGEPLAFVKAQKGWEFRSVPTLGGKAWELITLKPIWATYLGSDPHLHWANYPPHSVPELNLRFWNPVYWLFALVAVCVGYWRGVLTKSELVMSVLLLLIPYCLISTKAGMISAGRYSAVAFPVYIVAAHWLDAVPNWCKHLALSASLLLLFLYSAMFSRWYSFC